LNTASDAMRITIHRGTHEIGGNCIEIATDSTRIILDVGMPLFDKDRNQFDDKVLKGKSVNELLEAGILPSVEGLFAEGAAPDAILLSHAHMDHTGFLPYTRPEIPVYATSGTSKMMKAGAIFARQAELPRGRHSKVTPGVPKQIGDIQVTPFAVDHSAYGGVAFLIEGEGKTVLYSGDIRLHGRKTGMAKTLLAALKDKTVDLLLIEGTLLGGDRTKGLNEYELEREITDRIGASKGLVLASFSPQHVDRLVCFIRAAQRTNRTLAVDVYTAFIMHLIESEVKIPSPMRSEGIRVFYPQYFLSSYKRKRLTKVYNMFLEDQIELDEILANPAAHLMLFRTSMLDSDFGGNLPEQTLCLFSRWEGYLDQAEWQTTKAKLESVGGELVHAHTSGHAYVDDLKYLAQEIAPKKIVPIHTFNPDSLSECVENVTTMNDGETIEV
jgi:ribonuclease J